MLLAAFDARRATVDADLLAAGFPNDMEATLSRIRALVSLTPAVDDGFVFQPARRTPAGADPGLPTGHSDRGKALHRGRYRRHQHPRP
jgi:hypothetical protein